MRCSPSHLALPYLAVGTLLHSTFVVCLFACVFPGLDFGCGHTTQAPQLHRFPIATIYIDPALIQALWDSGWRIVAGAIVVVVQSLLIVALLLERSRKRRAAKALAESEDRYRSVVESQTELICRYLPDTTLTFVNDAYCRYFEKTRDQLIGNRFLSLIPEPARELARQQILSLAEHPRTEMHEHEVLRPDGSIGWHQWVNDVISRDGVVELQGIGRDITDRKLAQDALKVSEEFNRRIVESSSDCVKVLDLDGNLIYMSERGQKLLEIDDVEKVLGGSWVDLWQGENRLKARQAVEEASKGNLGIFHASAATMKNNLRWWHTVISPMQGTTGKVERLLAVSRDVSEQQAAVNALRESEERFAKAFFANPQPMSLTTLTEGRYIDVNDSFLQMSGYSRDEVIGHTSIELGIYETPDIRKSLLLDPLTNSRAVRNVEMKFRKKTGEFRVLLSSAELLVLRGQECILIASSDITDRKALEENLRLSEREFSTIVRNSPDVICRLDRNLRYIYISPSLEKIVEIKPDFLLGKTPRELGVTDWDWHDFEQNCLDAIVQKRTIALSLDYRGKHFCTRIIPEFSDDGDVESLMTITEDATERIRAEQELTQLTVRLFHLQDEERRRIARELHDGSAQDLFAISVNLAKLGQLSKSSPETQELVSECQSLCDQSLQEIRTLSYLLHPPLLDQVGLVSALQWYVEGFSKRSGIYVSVYAQQIGRLPGEVEMALFRVVQEALTNVRRHSRSETASIRLEKRRDDVVLEIKDQGQGLAVPVTRKDTNGLISIGVGIPGMRQRLSQLGGNLEILSSQSGTTISAVVPMRNGVNHGANTFS